MLIHLKLMGGFGNQLFQYAYGRATAEKHGAEFHVDDWVGNKLFDINHPTPSGNPDMVLKGYFQNQESLIYTRKQVKEWFAWKSSVKCMLEDRNQYRDAEILAHRRVGDYPGYGYVVVSKKSYLKASEDYGYALHDFITDDKPNARDESVWLPDFYRLSKSKVLFRGNSTFSWWAATLGNATVFSPVIDGLVGGQEHDCQFVLGNSPKFANIDGVTDLILPEL